MAPYSLYTVLSCHGLEDFPTHHKGESAHGLLASLTSLWHPAIVARAESMPRWCRHDQVPENCERTILVVPAISATQLPTGLAERVRLVGGLLITSENDRAAIVTKAHEYLQTVGGADTQELAADFFALGFAYWQVQLMTRQLRYSSHLDEVHFQNLVVAAAKAHAAQDWDECRRGLQAAFDLLLQERNRYFPVDALFVELVLVAATTIGDSLLQTIQSPTPVNVLLTGELIERIAETHPATIAAMKSLWRESKLELIGGSATEPRFSLMSVESLRGEIERGQAIFAKQLGKRPAFFARRRFGLTSVLPQILSAFGYKGAIHAPFDQGRFPPVAAGSIEWQSPDGSVIAALSTTPIDAAEPDAFARLGISIGESFDASHGAMALFAHWPSRRSIWFDDLLRTTKYGNILGRFVTLEEYFQKASYSGRREKYAEDQYRSEFLYAAQQAKQPDPISCVVNHWANRHALAQCGPLAFMAHLVSHATDAKLNHPGATLATLEAANDRLADGREIAANGESPIAASKLWDSLSLSETISQTRNELARGLADRLAKPEPASTQVQMIVANPTSFARRILCLTGPRFSSIPIEKPVYAVENGDEGCAVVVDVPPYGFAIVGATTDKSAKRRNPPIVDGHNLRNEFFDLEIDRETGGIRSIHTYDRRGNLFSQMLGLKLPPGRRTTGGASAEYAQPVANAIRTIVNHSVVGEIVTTGELLVDKQPLATFEQRIRVVRGRRVIELEIDFSLLEPLTIDPWRHYLASRFAWPSEGAELFRGVNETRSPIVESRIEAPQWIEIVDAPNRIAILTNGLPFHRRYDYRKLDTILSVSGETRTKFRLGIGVDVPIPAQAAVDFGSPAIICESDGTTRVHQPAAWLLRMDSRNLLATGLEPITRDNWLAGVRVRVKETEGRAGKAKIESARPLVRAARIRLDGESKSELNIADGAAEFGFAANEYLQVELYW